jgi:hypothetical protein
MKLLPLDKLGAREANGDVNFGVFFPWVSKNDGNRLWVKVIHEKDQFLQDIQPLIFEMDHSSDPEYGDYWSTQVSIPNQAKPHPISLVRKLTKLRREQSQFREGNYYFYNNYERYHSKNVLLFSRQHANKFSLVALNFGDSPQNVPIWFPISGDYREELHGQNNFINVPRNVEYWVTVLNNYGRIWTVTTGM